MKKGDLILERFSDRVDVGLVLSRTAIFWYPSPFLSDPRGWVEHLPCEFGDPLPERFTVIP